MPKTYHAASLSLPLGFRMRGYDESDVIALTKDPKQLVRIADVLNLYCHQKGGLVWGRSDLCEVVAEKLKFPPLTKKVTKDGEEVSEWDESEKEFLDRYAKAVAAGEVKIPGFTPSGSNEKEKIASVWGELQKYADQCGDTTDKGEPVTDAEGNTIPGRVPFAYTNDISRSEPKPKKAKGPSKTALEAAAKVIAGGPERVKFWKDRFSKGFTDAKGFVIAPISFQPFDTVAPKGAKPEEVQAVAEANQKALALAIDAKEAQVRAAQQAAVKAEFA